MTYLSSWSRLRSAISSSNLNFDTSQTRASRSPTTAESSRCSLSISVYWRAIRQFFSTRITSRSFSDGARPPGSTTLGAGALIVVCLLSLFLSYIPKTSLITYKKQKRKLSQWHTTIEKIPTPRALKISSCPLGAGISHKKKTLNVRNFLFLYYIFTRTHVTAILS